MTHYSHTLAIPGDIPDYDLADAVKIAMHRFDENRTVALHRDTTVYAETLDVQMAKAYEYAGRDPRYAEQIATMTPVEIAKDWSGAEVFDADGWPLTIRNPDGHWDYYLIGGRWAGAYVLRPGAEAGPLHSEDGVDDPRRTDCARWRDIMPESVVPTYSWVDLDGEWHTRWIGPTREEAVGDRPSDYSHWEVPEQESAAQFMRFLRDLPRDTWIVNIDVHS